MPFEDTPFSLSLNLGLISDTGLRNDHRNAAFFRHRIKKMLSEENLVLIRVVLALTVRRIHQPDSGMFLELKVCRVLG